MISQTSRRVFSSSMIPQLRPSAEVRMISIMRIVLAGVALLAVYIDPLQWGPLPRASHFLLIGYLIYSAMIYVLWLFSASWVPLKLLHWFDLAWYLILIASTGGSNSLFFFLLFFAILVASFRWGFGPGLRMTITAGLLFAIIGFAAAPPEPAFELNRFVLRTIYLLTLGYMIAWWGGSEVTLKHRLRLLKDMGKLSNPRFGIDRTISSVMDRICSFYQAEGCVLVQIMRRESAARITKVDGRGTTSAIKDMGGELAQRLLSPPPNRALIYNKRFRRVQHYDITSGRSSRESSDAAAAIAGVLDTSSFLSVPIIYRAQPAGRLYIYGSSKTWNYSDVEFVLQVIEHVTPVLDNVRLVDRLASDAAEQERQKLARDIHDSVIQPYVGLQMGLMAVRAKLANGKGGVLADVDELCELSNQEVSQLRGYLDRLKSDESQDAVLFTSVRRFASKYSSATGIAVELSGPEDLQINDRLAAEAFQMIVEGLSNVRRHTSSQRAKIEIDCDEANLILRIINDHASGADTASFRPASITERAMALGGTANVHVNNGRTTVDVRIPL